MPEDSIDQLFNSTEKLGVGFVPVEHSVDRHVRHQRRGGLVELAALGERRVMVSAVESGSHAGFDDVPGIDDDEAL